MKTPIKFTTVLVLAIAIFSCSKDDDNTPPEKQPAPKLRVVVSTLAGSTGGFADGSGDDAQFDYPTGVAVDALENVYVADRSNHTIRKISPQGVVSTLAGTGTEGDVDGPGTTAQFYRPSGVAVDAMGNVYVADENNHKIKKITPDGVVSTLAGSGIEGEADGAGINAQFEEPRGVTVDASGNVYVADSNNSKIRKINPQGVVTTLAGSGAYGFADGTGSTAQFADPKGVAVDDSGNVYVADQDNNKIRKITPNGVVSTLAGSGNTGFADGAGASALFDEPQDVAVDALGNVYVVDLNNRIRLITPDGEVRTLAGNGNGGDVDGEAASAEFKAPVSVTVDSSGNVYVADSENDKIRKITEE